MSATKLALQHQKYHYTSEDFKWPRQWHWTKNGQHKQELSKFDKELQERWDAAVDAGCFAYKLHHVEGRVVSGKYQLFIQLNEMRFNKRRQPEAISSISQPFNPEKFNFTKVHSKEVLFELCPRQTPAVAALGDDCNLMIINASPLEYGHSLLVPSVNSCLPQILTEEALLLALEISMLSNHRGFHVGFNSLCAHASVNHLHFHTWYSEYPSYLETTEVGIVCDNIFEVKNYPTTAFVFELAPETNVGCLARTIHKVASYLIKEEVAHNFHIIRGARCRPRSQLNGFTHIDSDLQSVRRVFLWPRNPVHDPSVASARDYAKRTEKSPTLRNFKFSEESHQMAVQIDSAKQMSSYESERRPVAVYEFGGSLAIERRETFNSFTEEQFCKHMRRVTLPEDEFSRHRQAIRDLFNKT